MSLLLLPPFLMAATLLLLAAAIAFGTRKRPPPLPTLTHSLERLAAMRFPAAHRFAARDGVELAYREYPAAGASQIAVLVHGSIHDSRTMHSVGALLAMQGVAAYALDVRGHGGSGRRGLAGRHVAPTELARPIAAAEATVGAAMFSRS
uniref:serine aminopeptidase domain-containing protein n=1 Tax=Ramlibacter sp. TaxID=1917967 RepID=UPI0017FB4DEA